MKSCLIRQLVWKFLEIYGIHMFIAEFTRARH